MTKVRLEFVYGINDALGTELLKHTNPHGSEFRIWLNFTPLETAAVVIFEEESKSIIGWAGCFVGVLQSSVGAFVDCKYRRQGLATAAISALLKHLRQEDLLKTSVIAFDTCSVITQKITELLDAGGFKRLGGDYEQENPEISP